MGKRSAEFDRYIAAAAPFARPILESIREAFHAGAPDVEEVIKWNSPHFNHKGILGGMAAFKKHVRWGFWKSALMRSPAAVSLITSRVTDISELPSRKDLVEAVREAARLNDEGAKVPRRPARAVAPMELPADLSAELRKNRKAKEAFDRFSPSHRREYIEWITEAKQEATRQKRLATAMEWIAEGKSRNWKYAR